MATIDDIPREYGLAARTSPVELPALPDGTKLSLSYLSQALGVQEYKPPTTSLEEALAALRQAEAHPLLDDEIPDQMERAVAQSMVGDPRFGLSADKVNDPDYMAAWTARLAHTGSNAEATAYADAVTAVSMSADAAVALAPHLTMKEITDPAFMRALAAAVEGLAWDPDRDPEGTAFVREVEEQLRSLRSDEGIPQQAQ